jgi:hypothetical protein
MSKQTGLIKLKGNIGGISFYKSGGEDLARIANGPSKERILNDSTFQRTRENNAEFGGSATVAKALRMSLGTALQGKGDVHLAARLTKIFKEINSKGGGKRGQRNITLSGYRAILEGFDFDERVIFSSIFNAPFTVAPNVKRDTSVVTVPNFLPQDSIKAPSGADYFRLISAIGVVSDYTHDDETDHYEPLYPDLNMLGAVVYSAMTALSVTAPVTFNLTTTVPGTPVPEIADDVSVVQCLGIEFYQRVGTVDYMLSQGNCLKVVKLF